MIFLASTSDKLQLVTASGVSTIHVHTDYVDTGVSAVPGRKNTLITTATTTDIVASPGATGIYRVIKRLSIRNSHASSSNVLTVQHTDGTTVAELFKYTLLAGESLHYEEGFGFVVIDATGVRK